MTMTISEYMAGLEKSVNSLLEENERLKSENERLQLENAEAQNKPDERDELINLLAQDIEWKEEHGTRDERLLRAIELYRKIRLKE